MVFRKFALILLLISAGPAFGQNKAPQESKAPKLETALDKTSYVIGYNFGRDILKQGLDANPQALSAGIAAALAGEKMTLTQEEIQAAFKELEAELEKKSQEIAAKNLEDGKKFLAANAKR